MHLSPLNISTVVPLPTNLSVFTFTFKSSETLMFFAKSVGLVSLANLEITERHAHSRRVNYVPADKDATILYPSLDLKFINNTSTDLKIYAETDNYSVTIKITKMEQSN